MVGSWTSAWIALAALAAGVAVAAAGLPSRAQSTSETAALRVLQEPELHDAVQLWERGLAAYRENEPRRALSQLKEAGRFIGKSQEGSREVVRFRRDGAEVAFFAPEPDEGIRWAEIGLVELPRVPRTVYYRELERSLDLWMLRTLLASNRALAGEAEGFGELVALARDPGTLTADAAYLLGRLLESSGQIEAARGRYQQFLAAGPHRTYLRRGMWARADAALRVGAGSR